MVLHNIPITIEYRRGDFKPDESSVIPTGWMLWADYGFINSTVSNEPGEELDVFVGTVDNTREVYLAFLPKPNDNGALMEVKVIMNVKDLKAARELIDLQYDFAKDCPMSVMTMDQFREDIQLGLQKFKNERSQPASLEKSLSNAPLLILEV